MKKRKLWLKRAMSLTIVVVMAFSFNCLALSSQKKVDTPHAYTVVPGSDEWASMSVQQRLASCKVTQAEVEAMTTEALIETVVNYPYLVNMYFYDTPAMGIEMVSNHFPGIKELASRDDAVEKLQEYSRAFGEAELRSSSLDVRNAVVLENVLSLGSNAPSRYTNTTLYTPRGNPVTAMYDLTWQEFGASMGLGFSYAYSNGIVRDDELAAAYPSAVRVTSVSNNINSCKYNCHSYAWVNTSTSNPYWVSDPTMYTIDGSYASTTAAANRKVTYTATAGSYSGRIIHSGIVYSVSGSNVTVTSKWGGYGVYRHSLMNCPLGIDMGAVGGSAYATYWILA